MSMKGKRAGFYCNKSNRFSEVGFALNLTKNKAIETAVLFDKDPQEWFRICTQWTRKVHQAGFCLSCTLFWMRLDFTFFDKRQWDYRNNTYQQPEPEPTRFQYF